MSNVANSPSPLQIGSLRLDFPVVQAALSGYSDMPMRVIARRMGASYAICEVMLDKFIAELKPRRKNQHFFAIADEEHPVGGQIMGADPEQFGPAAVRLVENGFDVIDINFGCPVKKVLGRCRGGFHLGQPGVALEIVKRVRDAVPPHVPVTVKMRRGIDESDESHENFYRIFDGAYELGVAAVTVHGRTVKQRYNGPSNWDFLREVKRHAGRRVILGSGDLFTAHHCLEMMSYTGVDGVTVARGAIGNPWIFRETRALSAGQPLPDPPTLAEQRAVIAEHYRLAAELYGADRCVPDMRKFAIKYAQLHPQHEQVRADFCRVQGAEAWQELLNRWYSIDTPGVRPESLEPNPCSIDPNEMQNNCLRLVPRQLSIAS
jgi:nifR3 family TIM-barrel protein